MARFAQTCQGVIAIDGKVVRRSLEAGAELLRIEETREARHCRSADP
jgi:hypothetical protein